MLQRDCRLVLFLLALALSRSDAAAPPVRPLLTDLHGDPLPPGAVARMGTVRFRHHPAVMALAFSPDGQTLVSGGVDGTLHLWQAASGKRVRSFVGHARKIDSIAFSPDGRLLAAASKMAGEVRLWEVATGKERHCLVGSPPSLEVDGRVKIAFDRKGRILCSAGWSGYLVRRWDVESGKRLSAFAGKAGQQTVLACSPDAETVVVWNRKAVPGSVNQFSLVNARTGKEICLLTGPKADVSDAVFSADGKHLVAMDVFGLTRLWRVVDGKKVACYTPSGASLLAFHPDGKQVMSVDDKVHLFDASSGKEARSFSLSSSQRFYTFALSSDGRKLAGANMYGAIGVWDVATGAQRSTRDLAGAIRGIALSPDGKTLYSAVADQTIRVWETATGKELPRLRSSEPVKYVLYDVAVSPDGKTLLSSMPLRLWDLSTGKLRCTLPGQAAVFAPDGKSVIACDEDGFCFWDVATGKPRNTIKAKLESVARLRMSSDGKLLALASVYGGYNVRLFDTAGAIVRTCGPLEDSVFNLVLSPDGRNLVTWGNQHWGWSWFGAIDLRSVSLEETDMRIWEVATGRLRLRLTHLHDKACTAAVSPDGRILAIGSNDGAVRLWALRAQKEVGRLVGHHGNVWAVAFTADGRRLVSGGDDGTAIVWDLRGRLKGARIEVPRTRLSPQDIQRAWARLAGENAAEAYQALRTLAGAPGQTEPLIRKHLRPSAAVTRARLARLLADLGDDNFQTRTQATAELTRLEERAAPALRALLAGKVDLEVRRRAEDVLKRIDGVGPLPASGVLAVRAVEVLEHLGTAEAMAVLRELARGAGEARLTREAKSALRRLTRRVAAKP